MDQWLHQIASEIDSGQLLPARYYRALNRNMALDARDNDEDFEANWLRSFNEMERRWRECSIAGTSRTFVDTIRQESFMAVSRATDQHEIASYVSDDFDLLVRSKLVGMEDGFLNLLWATYARGEFPYPPLSE